MAEARMFDVIQTVEVTVDETKFTPEFMDEFRKDFYQFDSVNEHRRHLAQLYARGIVDEFSGFIEGYGEPKEFGIKFREIHLEVEDAP